MQKPIKGSFALTAAVFIVLGLVLLLFPGIALRTACIILGVVVLIYGIMRIIDYTKSSGSNSGVDLLIGIALAVVGMFLIISPTFFLNIIPIILGIYIVLEGIFDIKRAVDLKKAGYERWWLALVVAIVVTVLGAILIFNPWGTNQMVVRILGIALIVEGASTLFATVKS